MARRELEQRWRELEASAVPSGRVEGENHMAEVHAARSLSSIVSSQRKLTSIAQIFESPKPRTSRSLPQEEECPDRMPCVFVNHGVGPLPLMGKQKSLSSFLSSYARSLPRDKSPSVSTSLQTALSPVSHSTSSFTRATSPGIAQLPLPVPSPHRRLSWSSPRTGI